VSEPTCYLCHKPLLWDEATGMRLVTVDGAADGWGIQEVHVACWERMNAEREGRHEETV
jgi:hypothetical protein